jgi:hypothetical protein
MLKISPKQQKSLAKKERSSFIQRVMEHVEEFFPEHYQALDKEQNESLIEYGIERAAQYNINSERDVCLYIDIMLALGPDFDENKKIPWALSILNDDSLSVPREKIDKLHDYTVKHMKSN